MLFSCLSVVCLATQHRRHSRPTGGTCLPRIWHEDANANSPPRFCHDTTQNTPKHTISSEKKHFSGEELGLAHILPLLLTKPLESAPSFPAKQIYASANQTYIHGLLQPASARLFRLLLFSGKFLKLNMCVSSQQ